MSKAKFGYQVLDQDVRCLIPQTLLCTWRKETAAGINDDDASSGKKKCQSRIPKKCVAQ